MDTLFEYEDTRFWGIFIDKDKSIKIDPKRYAKQLFYQIISLQLSINELVNIFIQVRKNIMIIVLTYFLPQ